MLDGLSCRVVLSPFFLEKLYVTCGIGIFDGVADWWYGEYVEYGVAKYGFKGGGASRMIPASGFVHNA